MPVPHPDVSIYAVDDHPAVLASVALVIDASPGFVLVGTAADGPTAIDAIGAVVPVPDLILMDLHMPGLDGLATAAGLAAAGVPSPVVIMSTADVEALPPDAFTPPVVGFLPKADLSTHALAALWAEVVGADARQ